MWSLRFLPRSFHYSDVIMDEIASQITSLTIVYSTVYSDADRRKRQSSASRAFVRGIHRSPMNSPHKWPVTRTMFPFDDVIMSRIRVTTGQTFLYQYSHGSNSKVLIALKNLTIYTYICVNIYIKIGMFNQEGVSAWRRLYSDGGVGEHGINLNDTLAI